MTLATLWGQKTTGVGISALLAALAGVAAGTMSWQQAIPLLIGGLVGILYPENPQMKAAAQTAAADVEAIVAAYRTGLQHGAAASPAPSVPVSRS